MRNKLLLEEAEDLEAEVSTEEDQPISDEVIDEFNIQAMISSLIKDKWGLVDTINGIQMTLGDKSEEINATLKEIVSDEYMHIGQLEKIIQSIKPEAINLEVEVK